MNHGVACAANWTVARRIVVKGSSGAGKSTLAAELARRLDLPPIELDGLYHGPGWTAPAAGAFRDTVAGALAAAPDGWVVDGNYDAALGQTVLDAADTIVWLDLPLRVKLLRVFRRTLGRLAGGDVELWNGNRESWRSAFASRDSILVWAVRQHRAHRATFPAMFEGDPRLVRLRSDAQIRQWIEAVAEAADRYRGSGSR